ncbi:MAG: hypothetical protein K9L29_09380, partial [Spirochaetales bacterium]|nr:hypothetical protein [Spirochaetales bacterium]
MKRIGIGACIAVFLLIGTFTLAAETAGEGGDAADGKGSSSFKDPASLSNEEARLVIEEMTAAMNRFSERMDGLA